jgi:iron-sulfur cluster assembly accessory protein
MNITITEPAIAHIQKIISAAKEPSFFRLAVKKSGCSGYRYDPQVVASTESGDVEVSITDDWVIFVEAGTERFFDGLTIELVEKFLGHQLVFVNPNADDECGCGESFSLKREG